MCKAPALDHRRNVLVVAIFVAAVIVAARIAVAHESLHLPLGQKYDAQIVRDLLGSVKSSGVGNYRVAKCSDLASLGQISR